LSRALSPGHNVSAEDAGLATLLELDGNIWEIGDGYWIKIDARIVPGELGRPYRLGYSLTLHAPDGERIVGFDNAHPVKVGSGPSRRVALPNDHTHRRGQRTLPYSYSDAATLLADFWVEVEDALKEEGVS
jgi:Family of unknown function (DUF6516)